MVSVFIDLLLTLILVIVWLVHDTLWHLLVVAMGWLTVLWWWDCLSKILPLELGTLYKTDQVCHPSF